MLHIVKLAKMIHTLKNHVQKYAPQYVYALLALIIIEPLLKNRLCHDLRHGLGA